MNLPFSLFINVAGSVARRCDLYDLFQTEPIRYGCNLSCLVLGQYVCVCVHSYINTYIHIYIIYMYYCTYCMYICRYLYVSMYVRLYMCVYIYLCVYTILCVGIYIEIYTHTFFFLCFLLYFLVLPYSGALHQAASYCVPVRHTVSSPSSSLRDEVNEVAGWQEWVRVMVI